MRRQKQSWRKLRRSRLSIGIGAPFGPRVMPVGTGAFFWAAFCNAGVPTCAGENQPKTTVRRAIAQRMMSDVARFEATDIYPQNEYLFAVLANFLFLFRFGLRLGSGHSCLPPRKRPCSF